MPDLPLADLPLRDDARRPESTSQRELTFGQQPERAPVRGVLVWFVAAAALVAGIVIGFTSGYAAGQRNAVSVLGSSPGSAPEATADTSPPPIATSSPAASSQTFSEATVPDPPRVDPEPIVVPEDRSTRSDRSSRSEIDERSNVPNVRRAPNVSNVSNDSNVSNGPGSIEVLSRPAGAQVIVDGRIVGRTPLSIPNVTAGTHSIRLELAGFNRWATSVEVTPGMRARVAASLEQP
jgi:hypothetical protein